MAELSANKAFGFKRKRFNNNQKGKGKLNKTGYGLKKGNKQFKYEREKCGERKDKTKVTCYKYGNLSHFAHECTEPKQVSFYQTSSKKSYVFKIFVSSTILLTETHPM